MNPDIAYAPPNAEPTAPDLADVLNLLERFAAAPYKGVEYHQLIGSIYSASAYVADMEGLVLDGEVYDVPAVARKAVAS